MGWITGDAPPAVDGVGFRRRSKLCIPSQRRESPSEDRATNAPDDPLALRERSLCGAQSRRSYNIGSSPRQSAHLGG